MDIQDHNTPEQQTQTKAKAAAARTIEQKHLRQDEAIARAEHRLYIKNATKAAATQARAEADARKAAAREKEKSDQASKRAARP